MDYSFQIIFLLSLAALSSCQKQCGENAFVAQIQADLISKMKNPEIQQVWSDYKESYPTVISDPTSLKHCQSNFGSMTKTCCPSQVLDQIESIFQIYTDQSTNGESKPMCQYGINFVGGLLKTCGLKSGQTLDPMDLQGVFSTQAGRTYNSQEKAAISSLELQAQFILTTIQYLRGNLCIMCQNPDENGEAFFQDGKLVISQQSFANTKAERDANLGRVSAEVNKCRDSILQLIDEKGDPLQCATTKFQVVLAFNFLDPCKNSADCPALKQTEIKAFSSDVDLALAIDPNALSGIYRRGLHNEYRNLATTSASSDVLTTSTGGIKTLVSSSTDKNLKIAGNISVNSIQIAYQVVSPTPVVVTPSVTSSSTTNPTPPQVPVNNPTTTTTTKPPVVPVSASVSSTVTNSSMTSVKNTTSTSTTIQNNTVQSTLTNSTTNPTNGLSNSSSTNTLNSLTAATKSSMLITVIHIFVLLIAVLL